MADRSIAATRLRRLGAQPLAGRSAPSERLVAAFERKFELHLPTDYRAFLVKFGGTAVSASCPVREPTPFGPVTPIHYFFGFMRRASDACDIRSSTELAEGAPVAIPIGGDQMGTWLYLMCAGKLRGTVFVHDHELRSTWSDAQFRARFPKLAPEIRQYLGLRRKRQLPDKPEQLNDFYLLGTSFTDFLKSCEAAP